MKKCYIVFANYHQTQIAMSVFESKAAAKRYVAKLNRYLAKKPVLRDGWDSAEHIQWIMEKTKWINEAPVRHCDPDRGWFVAEFDFHPAK